MPVFAAVAVAVAVPVAVVSDRPAGFRPPRLDVTYSHVIFRFKHLEQEGFCRWQRTLDDAHATQLSRSFGTCCMLVLFADDWREVSIGAAAGDANREDS